MGVSAIVVEQHGKGLLLYTGAATVIKIKNEEIVDE